MLDRKEGELKKRRVYVIDVFRDVNTKPIEGLEDRTSEMVFMSDIDETKKDIFEDARYEEYKHPNLDAKNRFILIKFEKWKKWFGGSS